MFALDGVSVVHKKIIVHSDLELTFKFPLLDSQIWLYAILKKREKLRDTVYGEIFSLAGNNLNEVSRIKNSYKSSKDFQLNIDSFIEVNLSLALLELDIVMLDNLEKGDISMALDNLTASAEYLSIARGAYYGDESAIIKRRNFLKSAANKRHAENNAIKEYGLKYYQENIDKFDSKDNAAEQIAGKIVKASFRTVRKWITDYHKNIRSTGIT